MTCFECCRRCPCSRTYGKTAFFLPFFLLHAVLTVALAVLYSIEYAVRSHTTRAKYDKERCETNSSGEGYWCGRPDSVDLWGFFWGWLLPGPGLLIVFCVGYSIWTAYIFKTLNATSRLSRGYCWTVLGGLASSLALLPLFSWIFFREAPAEISGAIAFLLFCTQSVLSVRAIYVIGSACVASSAGQPAYEILGQQDAAEERLLPEAVNDEQQS
eukprot:c9085_g1_i2.p1 GENE.c9085_g1_i2~~c9085_g1_i2.p1  ORF type:complete len:225 (-),score=14.81 c9085_g1_i2:173-814(-)